MLTPRRVKNVSSNFRHFRSYNVATRSSASLLIHSLHSPTVPGHRASGTRWPLRSHPPDFHRTLSTLSTILLPPATFIGLVIALWTYKCLMMVIFQNKIIYMPSVPPFSRSEKISDYANACKPIVWRQEMIRSLDGTKIALAVGENVAMQQRSQAQGGVAEGRRGLVVLYFQGNAASLPPRLPSLSSVLKMLNRQESPILCTLIALSYRGFWTSSGRASQAGIEKDAAAALAWVHEYQEKLGMDTKLVLWGQSIGAGVASVSAANLLQRGDQGGDKRQDEATRVARSFDALILETPFTSIKNMLINLYPQKWLPYRYLWPFLMSTWDNENALRIIHERERKVPLLIVTAEKDEVVPAEHGEELMRLCGELGMDVRRVRVAGALHTEAMSKESGRQGVVDFLKEVHQKGR